MIITVRVNHPLLLLRITTCPFRSCDNIKLEEQTQPITVLGAGAMTTSRKHRQSLMLAVTTNKLDSRRTVSRDNPEILHSY